MKSLDTKKITITAAKKMLADKEISASELFTAHHDVITARNADLNAFLEVYAVQEHGQGILAGIPGAIKDNILIEGRRCTAASKILENYTATYDATVINKLRAAGAVFLGKTNLDEFAMGTTGENSAFGPTRNPLDTSRVAGGSSSGSVAAVAGGLAMFALGSDTGGSIRLPAALCGVVGLKPTYGRVSRHGLIAMASSLDQIGPITRTVEDSASVFNAIAGHDLMDSTTVPHDVPDFTAELKKSVKGLKAAVPEEFFGEGLAPGVRVKVEEAIATLQKLGIAVERVRVPLTEYALAAYYVLVPSEISANLARYDGVRYGLSAPHAVNYTEQYKEARHAGFGPETRRRIIIGTYVLSAGYYDAYYKQAQKVRSLLIREYDKLFKTYDIVIGPTSPMLAPKLGELADPLAMYLADVYTVPANLTGLPAISVPCGLAPADDDGTLLPVGLQIIGRAFDEATILRAAYALEQSLSS